MFFFGVGITKIYIMTSELLATTFPSIQGLFRIVPDLRCRYLDIGPKFGWYWHFFGACLNVSILEKSYKWVSHTSSEKVSMFRLCFI